MPGRPKTLVAILQDLFFRVKIADAAKREGFQTVFVDSQDAAMEQLMEPPSIMLLDLNCAALDPLRLIVRIKAQSEAVPLIGFVSHVQQELRQKAQEAGCDLVFARSVFSSKLPEILREHSSKQ